jgi:hypothetical protein
MIVFLVHTAPLWLVVGMLFVRWFSRLRPAGVSLSDWWGRFL